MARHAIGQRLAHTPSQPGSGKADLKPPNVLDVNAPRLTYEVDKLPPLFWISECEMSLEMVRRSTNDLGTTACQAAATEIFRTHSRLSARLHQDKLARLQKALSIAVKSYSERSVQGYAPDLHLDGSGVQADIVSYGLETIHDKAFELEEMVRSFLNATKVPVGRRRNVNPLVWWFICFGARRFRWNYNKVPPISRLGPFPEYLAASWTDLGLQSLVKIKKDRRDLQGWFGSLAEEHPEVHRIKRAGF